MPNVTVKTNAQLEAEEKADYEAEMQRNAPIVNALSSYVQKAYEDAERFRSTTNVTQRLIECQRQNAGKYTATKAAQIERTGGSRLYANVTQTKTQAAEAWLGDVFTPAADKPWDVVPTPMPDLPQDVKQEIVENVVQQATLNPDLMPADLAQLTQDAYDQVMNDTFEEARKRSERMSQKMEDQCVEGAFTKAFNEFISYLTFLPSAVMKGPIIRHRKRLEWVEDESGVTDCRTVMEAIPTFEAIDPFWFYPGPNARTTQDSYLCEIVHWDPKQLADMRGVGGYKDTAINAVLEKYPRGLRVGRGVYQEGENEHETLNERELLYNEEYNSGTLQGIEFWGSVKGDLLLEWGMKGLDATNYYEVTAVLIGNYVVKAILNPDPLDRRPYFVDSWFHNPSSIWGTHSLPEQMSHCQDAVNATQRNLINNLGLSSGPQVMVDIDALPPEMMKGVSKMYPHKIWQFHGSKSASRKPIEFFQPDSNASELIAVSRFFQEQADELTMIPRYVYGNENVSGAAETATGLGMLMKSASRGIKRVIKNIDNNVLRPMIERLYTWNMKYLPDAQYKLMKGDCQVVPRGALAILVKEQTQLRQQEFLDRTANPVDMQIIGIEGRAALLREVAKSLDIAEDKIVPSEEILRQKAQNALTQQAQEEAPRKKEPETIGQEIQVEAQERAEGMEA